MLSTSLPLCEGGRPPTTPPPPPPRPPNSSFRRQYWITDQIDWLADRPQWEKLRTVALVQAEREIGGQRSVQRRVFLCSLPPDARLLERAVRGHWGIENQLHWVLDVQFDEDQCRVRVGHAAQNLAPLRRIAVNLLRQEISTQRGIKGKQLKASWDHAYLQSLLNPRGLSDA